MNHTRMENDWKLVILKIEYLLGRICCFFSLSEFYVEKFAELIDVNSKFGGMLKALLSHIWNK